MRALFPALLATALLGCAAQQQVVRNTIPGEPAPEFELPSTTGKTISLAQYRGNLRVVVAFFPKAFTGS